MFNQSPNPEVGGSSPSPATIWLPTGAIFGGVAQLARAFGSYPECHVFESHRRYQTGASKKYAPEKPRCCLGFSFPERVHGTNGLP